MSETGAPDALELPQAEISNGIVRAKLYLADPVCGFYRATRFDWSGIVANLEFNGHSYFGQWYERHDPKIHDAITGPAEEFHTDGGLGYAEAGAGGAFVRIGVGMLRKPEEPAYRRFGTYEILDPGRWTCRREPDSLEFTHELGDEGEYRYFYRKCVRLEPGRAELTLEHSLRNIGGRVIETTQYNHNFFVIDRQPCGPDFVIAFPFELRASEDLRGLAEVRAREMVFPREFQKGQSIYTPLEGFGETAADYDINVENHKTGAGVWITGDQPISKLVLWAIRTTVCPEPHIKIRLEPGSEACWRISYQFYTLL